MDAALERGESVGTAGLGRSGRLDQHVHAGVQQLVGSRRRHPPPGAPREPQRRAGAIGVEIHDGGDLDPLEPRRLGEQHRSERACAREPEAKRPPAGGPGREELEETASHGARSYPVVPTARRPGSSVRPMRLAVVGGGMAGLAAAWEAERIAERDGLELDVTLLEASDRLGGKVSTVREDGFVVEAGADAIVRYKPWALELARDLELAPIPTLPASPAAWIVRGGRARALPAGLNVVVPVGPPRSLARSPLLSARGKARALGDLVLPRGPGLDEPFGAFVERRLGREVWEALAAPLIGGIYGGDSYDLSTEAAFPQLLELERRHRSLILGSRAVLRERASRRDGGNGVFASFAGGLGTLPEAVVAALSRTEIRLETEVERLEELEADAVVLAVPAHRAATILADAVPEAAAVLATIPYADAPTVTLAFAADGFPGRSGHGVLFAEGEGHGVRGLTWIDRKWPGRAPGGTCLVRAFVAGNEPGRSDDDLVDLALAALQRPARAAPRSHAHLGLPLAARHCRATPSAIPAGCGRSTRRSRGPRRCSSPAPDYRGVGVPDVVRDGREAARRAVRFLVS